MQNIHHILINERKATFKQLRKLNIDSGFVGRRVGGQRLTQARVTGVLQVSGDASLYQWDMMEG